MGNLIDRQQAIDALMEDAPEVWTDSDYELGMKNQHQYDVSTIKALPSAEPHWIPVTERLPEKDGRYLITCSKWGAWEVDWNIWHNDPKPSWLWEQGVTAWMPLPEPYKEKE